MSLRTINLNLVPTLLTLLKTRSVSRAADILGLSQGAASNALSRLRATFDDELLVRVGGHLELTPRAVELIAPAEQLCAELEGFFSRPRFDPGDLDRTFVFAAADYVTFLLADPLIEAVAATAPRVRLRFVEAIEHLTERMSEREIDLAIFPEAYLSYLSPARFQTRHLFNERGVAVFRRGHPLARREAVSEADLAAYRAIAFHPDAKLIDRKDPTLFLGGGDFDVVAFVPQVTSIPYLLQNSDYFALLPERIARRMAKTLPIVSRPLTMGHPGLPIVLAWSPVHERDPAHIWMRDIVCRLQPAD